MEFFNKKNQPPADSKPKELWRIREWFPDISEETDQRLKVFHSELVRYNSSLSLVSDRTLPFADVIHFADSILSCREIIKDSKLSSVIDIGVGNGFPGLVMATLYPNVKVTFIDRDARKIEFMKHVGSLLKLGNVEYKISAIEALQPKSMDLVMMRGFAAISKAILALRKQMKRNGVLYMMKGEEWATEIANIPSQLCSFWTPSLVGEYRLPVGEVKFAVVKLIKIAD